MGSCYSGDHIIRDHIHTDITTCNTEASQQKHRLGTVSNSFLVSLNLFYRIQSSPVAFAVVSNIWSAQRFPYPINTGNKQITDKTYETPGDT